MSAQPPLNTYYPNVDGLRAVAVLCVLFFHLDVSAFKGGFVGVDVFFVISGYLITSQILESLGQGSFNFATFYHRRARRILPALLFILGVVLIAGGVTFGAVTFEKLAESSMFSLFSLANIYFLETVAYFDIGSSLKPLLHLWSVSLEGQFYLIWPVFLLLIKSHKLLPYILVAISITCLALSEYYLRHNPSLVFYMTPFRMVEFCIGALLFWLRAITVANSKALDLISIIGLLMIIGAVFFYDESIYFPGVSVLIPCVGAALVIYSARDSIVGKFLQLNSLRYIGLVSYSLYLIHWPIIVFYKYKFGEFLAFPDQLLIIALSFGGAMLMYSFIEKPFRKKEGSYSVSNKQFYTLCSFVSVLLLVISANIYATNGWSWRYPESNLIKSQISESFDKRNLIYQSVCQQRGQELCNIPSTNKANNILVIGDSHAIDGFNIFAQAFPDYHYVLSELGGCPPLVPEDYSFLIKGYPAREECIALNQERLSQENLNEYEYIIVSVLFSWYHLDHFKHVINKIHSLSNAKIIVLGNYIELNLDMAELMVLDIDPRFNSQYINSFALYEKELQALSENSFTFVSKKQFFCEADDIASCAINFNGVPYSYDKHHLTLEASTAFSQYLFQLSNAEIDSL